MKICLISYRYFVTSGPERYLFGVKDLLEERGHEVIPFSVRYRANEPTPWAKYFVEPIAGDDEVRFRQHSWTPASVRRALERAFYSREVYDALSAELREARPDVAYVLPYIRKLSPSVLVALHDHGVPTAVRFSDFAMVCPQPHLFRNDQICELCVGGSLWPSVRYRCVQGSLGASAVNALAMYYAARKGYFGYVDAFVAPSEIMRQKMIEGGMPASRLRLLPTFVKPRAMRPFAERQCAASASPAASSASKGVHLLLAAFDQLQRRGVDDRRRARHRRRSGHALRPRHPGAPAPVTDPRRDADRSDRRGRRPRAPGRARCSPSSPRCGTRTCPTPCSRAWPAARR